MPKRGTQGSRNSSCQAGLPSIGINSLPPLCCQSHRASPRVNNMDNRAIQRGTSYNFV